MIAVTSLYRAGSVSLEICRQGEQWICLLRRARLATLVLLLGASGAVLYYLAAAQKIRSRNGPRSRRSRTDRGHGSGGRRLSPRGGGGFWRWLFAEELVEDLTGDAYFLHSHYFGPAASGRAAREFYSFNALF